MKKIRTILVIFIFIFATTAVTARPNQGLAIGAQVGFLATGIVVDLPLGPVAINAGINYPMGFKYLEWISESSEDADFFQPYFTVTGDITAPIPLGDNFDLKLGVSTVAFTDFSTGMYGVAGGAIKGEYWIPNKNTGLFVNLNVPVVIYFLTENEQLIFSNPVIPLIGLFTTTAGVLWTF